MEVIEDLEEKAETQLSKLQKAEVNARPNFEILKQALEDSDVRFRDVAFPVHITCTRALLHENREGLGEVSARIPHECMCCCFWYFCGRGFAPALARVFFRSRPL